MPEQEEIKWFIGGEGGQEAPETKKLPYVSTWVKFLKLPEDEKERTFNAMRGVLITTGQMENK